MIYDKFLVIQNVDLQEEDEEMDGTEGEEESEDVEMEDDSEDDGDEEFPVVDDEVFSRDTALDSGLTMSTDTNPQQKEPSRVQESTPRQRLLLACKPPTAVRRMESGGSHTHLARWRPVVLCTT
jgi:hypothetical protein